MKLKKGDSITVTIEKLAFGGKGIGHIEIDNQKFVVFVDNAIPNETIEAKLTKIKKNYAEARKHRVIKKSPLYNKAKCKHFDICGGCKLQNLSYEKQLEIKEEQVKESLDHIGGFKDISSNDSSSEKPDKKHNDDGGFKDISVNNIEGFKDILSNDSSSEKPDKKLNDDGGFKDISVKDTRNSKNISANKDSDSERIHINPIIGCDEKWFYRNKMEFSFGSYECEKITVGLHPQYKYYDVFQIEECFLQNNDIGKLLKAVRDFCLEHKLTPYHHKSNTGLLRSLIIRESKYTDERLVNLLTSHEPFESQSETAEKSAADLLTSHEPFESQGGHTEKKGADSTNSPTSHNPNNLQQKFIDLLTNQSDFKKPTSIYHTQQITKKGKKTKFIENHLYGKKTLTEKLQTSGGDLLQFEILPQAFFQTNTKQAEILYSKVIELSNITKNDIVFDLFCGTGTIGLFAAHKAKQIIGIDSNKSAIENAKQNATYNKITNADFITGDVFKTIQKLSLNPEAIIVDTPPAELIQKLTLNPDVVIIDPPPEELGQKNSLNSEAITGDPPRTRLGQQLSLNPDVIIVDPPRAGLGQQLTQHLAIIKAPRIVYVSCNPTTLAHDLKILNKGGYNLKTVQPIDMFPHTYHIETVCMLEYNPNQPVI